MNSRWPVCLSSASPIASRSMDKRINLFPNDETLSRRSGWANDEFWRFCCAWNRNGMAWTIMNSFRAKILSNKWALLEIVAIEKTFPLPIIKCVQHAGVAAKLRARTDDVYWIKFITTLELMFFPHFGPFNIGTLESVDTCRHKSKFSVLRCQIKGSITIIRRVK